MNGLNGACPFPDGQTRSGVCPFADSLQNAVFREVAYSLMKGRLGLGIGEECLNLVN